MRSVYRVFAFIIAAEVVIQAAAIAFALFGLGKWIEDGGTLNKATMEGDDSGVGGVAGFAVHGINGTMIVPLLAIVFLVVSFFAKVPGGVRWAGITFALVVVQVTLGLLGHNVPALGALHGINALALFSVALMAGKRVGSTSTAGAHTHATATATV
ncbi:MAG: hypothetical protein ABIQ59_01815 [Nocardioidaceae bacterium]